MIRLKVILFLILVTILVGLIYTQTTQSSYQEHYTILNQFQKIEKNSVILNDQILKAHQGLLRNYDQVLSTIDTLEEQAFTLNSSKIYHQPHNIKHLQKLIIELESSTEHFLSVNAILNNSLSYLPVLTRKFTPITTHQREITELVHQLLAKAFLFTRWHEPEQKADIDILIDKLLAHSLQIAPNKAKLLTTIIAHAQIVNEYSDLMAIQLNTIFSINISEAIHSMRQQYLQGYTKTQQQSKYLNWAIYGIALSLILIIFNVISTIRSFSNSLRDINKQLLQEIQQRIKIEEKERAEAQFLQTILDNISDGIVVCDAQGVLVLFNKAAEAIYGQGLKPLPIEQWADQYQLYDKTGKNILTREQLPLYKALTQGQVRNEEIVIKFNHVSPKTVLINGTKIDKDTNNGAIICIRDITERKKTEMEMRLAATAFEAHEGIMIADEKGHIVRINQKFTEITGYTEQEVLGKNPRILKSGKHDLAFYQNLWQTTHKNGYWQGEIVNQRKDGEEYLEWMSISVVKNELDEISHYISHFRDISESKKQQLQIIRNADEQKILAEILQFSFLSLEAFLQQSLDAIISLPWLKLKPKAGIFLHNEENILTLACNHNLSPELLTLCAKVPFGKCLCGKAAETGNIQFSSCIDHRHEITFQDIEPHGHYNVPIMNGPTVLGVIVLYLANNYQQQDHEVNFLTRVSNVLGLGILRKQAEKRVEYLAYYDELTTLPNRVLLKDRLEQIINSNNRQTQLATLMCIDLDRFKNINESLGHSVGDALLQEVSRRFQSVLRQEDTVARLGGDEFVILLKNMTSNKEIALMQAQHIANNLHDSIAEELNILNHRLFITLSIGVVIITGNEHNTETIMMQADTAMYQAKDNGKNGTQFFIPEMQTIAKVRLELEKDLRYAIERQEIQVFYQPQTNNKGVIVGAEALIRWIHPQRGFVSPVDFIPIAEESNIILEMGRYVLEDACLRIKQWKNIATLQHIAVNVSPIQFRQPDFVSTIQQVIKQTNIDANKLTLELTEGILVKNVDDVIFKMQELKKLGVHFSIDDFGTGYSSLAYLTKFPLDQLKIDKSFVDEIGKDGDDQIIIETIIAMADRLSFNLIAEGVETIEQIQFLKEKGCFNYQGYYFSKPLPSDEFSKKYL